MGDDFYIRIRSLPEDELRKGLGSEAAPFYLDELERRKTEKLTTAMVRYTFWITVMTAVMTVATIVNVILAFCPQR